MKVKKRRMAYHIIRALKILFHVRTSAVEWVAKPCADGKEVELSHLYTFSSKTL